MINKVTLLGNLGRDPEIRHFEGGSKVTQFSLATNENYQDKTGQWQTKTEWHNIVIWGNAAERAEKQLKKGNLVYIEGKITTRKWQDKDGNDRYNTDIVANLFRSLERRESTGEMGGEGFTSVGDQFAQAPATPAKAAPTEDDDLPF